MGNFSCRENTYLIVVLASSQATAVLSSDLREKSSRSIKRKIKERRPPTSRQMWNAYPRSSHHQDAIVFWKNKTKSNFSRLTREYEKKWTFCKSIWHPRRCRPLDPRRTIDKISLDKSDTSMLTLLLRNYGYCYILYLSGQWENMRAWKKLVTENSKEITEKE